MEITKIVITGGPCAGKTKAVKLVKEHFEALGLTVLAIPETATELILGGVTNEFVGSAENFQTCILGLQLEKERIFEKAAHMTGRDKALIICDRGTADNSAYLSDKEYKALANRAGFSEFDLRERYDAVFHLETAAKSECDIYDLTSNSARSESAAEAAELDDRLISAYVGHPHFRIIRSEPDFQTKMTHLISEISSFLGIPEPIETERKYLIEYPNLSLLEGHPFCRGVDMVQTYLKADSGMSERVRKRYCGESTVYIHTAKKRLSDMSCYEYESRISEKEYLSLLERADENRAPIRKKRYCLVYDKQYFEIDVYPFWNDRAIMEIELSGENDSVNFPDFIKIIKEVTYDKEYKNASLAKKVKANENV